MRSPARPDFRRLAGARIDHVLLLAGGAVTALSAWLPWIRGSTRLNGYIDWTGFSDTGEGAMFLAAGLAIAAWVRWRGVLEIEMTPRLRFLPLAVGVACALLWVISFRKALYLSWFELEVGARPQVGLLVSAVGIVLVLAGAALAATDPDSVAAARAAAEREKRRSGAGGDGAASDRLRRGGGGSPPNPDEYSVVSRVDPASGRADAGGDVDRERG